MVDFESYLKYGFPFAPLGESTPEEILELQCECSRCHGNPDVQDLWRIRYDGMTGADDEEWEDDQLMLCPPRVLGYILNTKQWAQLGVEGLQILDQNMSAFNQRLKLQGEDGGKETKALLMGLVENHGQQDVSKDGYELEDIVPGKGKGLVILLYGMSFILRRIATSWSCASC